MAVASSWRSSRTSPWWKKPGTAGGPAARHEGSEDTQNSAFDGDYNGIIVLSSGRCWRAGGGLRSDGRLWQPLMNA
eukprot:8609313-Heterocapsa_arctica.AAC.1